MSEQQLRTGLIRQRGRHGRSLLAAMLGIALVGAGATACAPETPSPLAACPARTEVPLEPPDPVDYSLPRAVSPDGEWLVASRAVGTELALSLRRTGSDSTSTAVGSLPYAQAATGTLLVSVPADGSQVVFGTAGTAATEDAPQTTLRRWRASSGTVSDLPVPVIASPPPGVPYPINAFAVSADGQRVLWRQSFREGPEPYVWHRVLVVTDASTDAVLSAATTDVIAPSWVTGDGAAGLAGSQLVDTATGVVTDLSGEVAAAQAAFPGTQLQVSGISDDLRHLALRRYDPTVVPGLWTYISWDRDSGTGRVALQLPTTGQPGQPSLLLSTVAPGGSLLLTRWSSPPDLGDIVEAHPTAGVLTVASASTLLTPQFSWMVATSDGRTVVTSRQSLFGQQLVAQRCV
jgi:hypothetical protein